MKRRTVVGWLLAGLASIGARPWRAAPCAQTTLSEAGLDTLQTIYAALLPESADDTLTLVDAFRDWVADHRSGVDMGYGYGILRRRTTPRISFEVYDR